MAEERIDNGSRCPMGVRNDVRIGTLEREMKQMRSDVRGLHQRMDKAERREAGRKGQMTAYATIGAIIGTAIVQAIFRVWFGT